jgi:polysaccharide pyruvyl transferase WcaK-like protein
MGFGNLGDDATQVAVMQNIRKRWPHVELVLFSMNPADSRTRHGLPAYPIRAEFRNLAWKGFISNPVPDSELKNPGLKSFLKKNRLLFTALRRLKAITIRPVRKFLDELRFLGSSFKIVRSLDLLIISGGGQLLDAWGGAWRFPYTIFKWTALAKLAGNKCYFLNVGAGPLARPLGRWFVCNALRLADYVSFRDGDSKVLIQKSGFKGRSEALADCVYALDSSESVVSSSVERGAPVVGLSPMAYCDPRLYWHKDQAVYDDLVNKFSTFGRWLIENQFHLRLFSTDIHFDMRTIKEVTALLTSNNGHSVGHWIEENHVKDLDQLLSTMRSVDYIVTCRFHGVVLAHLLNKPILALSHHPKVSTLMRDLGMERYCLDITKCDARMLEDAFRSLVAEGEGIKIRLADKVQRYRGALINQFDQLFSPRAALSDAGGTQ